MFPQIGAQVDRDAHLRLADLLTEEPAVLVEGPRGSGKSTLIRALAAEQGERAHVIDLDDPSTVGLIREDPVSALERPGLVVIDEFQRVPAVLSVVKGIVDRTGEPGRFLLAGSVSARLLPTGSETLTGRLHRLRLEPLTAGEVLAGPDRLLPRLLANPVVQPTISNVRRRDYFDLVAAGGYPAALRRTSAPARSRWLSSYLAAVAERDLPDLVALRYPGALGRLYRLVAERSGSVLTGGVMGDEIGLSPETARAYLDLLREVFLVREVPSWTVGVSAKVGRRSSVHVVDTGLACAATGRDAARLAESTSGGHLLESFVVGELTRQAQMLDEPLTIARYRDRSGLEVDIVVERPDGRVIAFEVKSSTSVTSSDARGLTFLRDRLGDRFSCGVVLFTGAMTARLTEMIWAMPISALWRYGDARPIGDS